MAVEVVQAQFVDLQQRQRLLGHFLSLVG
jgi:hypothetical protein